MVSYVQDNFFDLIIIRPIHDTPKISFKHREAPLHTFVPMELDPSRVQCHWTNSSTPAPLRFRLGVSLFRRRQFNQFSEMKVFEKNCQFSKSAIFWRIQNDVTKPSL